MFSFCLSLRILLFSFKISKMFSNALFGWTGFINEYWSAWGNVVFSTFQYSDVLYNGQDFLFLSVVAKSVIVWTKNLRCFHLCRSSKVFSWNSLLDVLDWWLILAILTWKTNGNCSDDLTDAFLANCASFIRQFSGRNIHYDVSSEPFSWKRFLPFRPSVFFLLFFTWRWFEVANFVCCIAPRVFVNSTPKFRTSFSLPHLAYSIFLKLCFLIPRSVLSGL